MQSPNMKSRKMWAGLISIFLTVFNRKLGLELTENEIMIIAGIAATYIGVEGMLDFKKSSPGVVAEPTKQ